MIGPLTYAQTPAYKILDTVSSKIKVLCLSIHYPLSMSRYFEKALRHRYDVDLITVGPYTGNWIPWMGGMTVLEKYALPPDISLDFPPNIGQVNYDLVKAKLKEMFPMGWVPDIVLTIDAGIHFKYKPREGLVVHIATDPHALPYAYQRTISDKFFNMQACYSQKGDIYLPYAYSRYDHYPETHTDENGIEQPKDVDAVLIGMPYPQRIQWVNELRKQGVSVIFENGPIFDEARALYNRGKMGLNWSSLLDTNARFFELPAMGLCAVMNNVPDAPYFMERDVDYLGFSNTTEAIEKTLWAKNNPKEAKEIADKGYSKISSHTYDKRIESLLKECGVI